MAKGPTSIISDIAKELNQRAQMHPIGRLQDLRHQFKQLPRHPGTSIFRTKTIFDEYAFHWGGRSELQFNIGLEDRPEGYALRYGVAFSLQTNRNLPSIDVLIPKIRLFNEFMRLNPGSFGGMRMWGHDGGQRSSDREPGPIPSSFLRKGVFLFLGDRETLKQIDCEAILSSFDRLLPLYRYVESGAASRSGPPDELGFTFNPGCTPKAASAVATLAGRELDVGLRHNELQKALHDRLVSEFGADNVGTEIRSGAGTHIDVVVKLEDGFWFYEIKTSAKPRTCIREAIGQLLEYSFWPGAKEPKRLVIVGEPPLDDVGRRYLGVLNERFSVPIAYEQVTIS